MIQLKEHFTYAKLLRYTSSAIVMMVFTSVYGVVDGLFVSNYAGKTALAAVNFILPFLMILGGVGFMFGCGGSALIAKTLGERHNDRANEIFSSLIVTSALTGVMLTAAGLAVLRPLAQWLGARDQLLEDCLLYGRIYLLGIPGMVVQYEFQNLYSAAGKPKLGLWSTVASGLTNILLDWLFVACFSWGIGGAAAATVLSQALGGIIPVLYFVRKNDSLLRLTRFWIDWKSMGKICSNGASELLNNISLSIVSMIFNAQLLRYAGDNGLAAYGVLMYIQFVFISIFIGYTIGSAPIISYHFGARNQREIKSLLHKSLVLLGTCSAGMFLISELSAGMLADLFVGYDPVLREMTLRGFLLYSFSYLFTGFAIFNSSFFTALNNGLLSAVISFMRTIVFQIAAVLIMPVFWEMDGIWLSVTVSEILAVLLGAWFLIRKRKVYGYG